MAKAAELSAAGRPVPASTVKHRRQRWEAYGLPGLADRRLARRKRPAVGDEQGKRDEPPGLAGGRVGDERAGQQYGRTAP